MPRAQGRIFGFSSNRKGPINICPNVSRYKDIGVLGIKVADGILLLVTYISLILLHLTYIYKNFCK